MRFTPTAEWASVAKSAAVDVRWHLYLKKVTVLDEALGSGTWVDVTERLSSWPQIQSALEFETGQFTADEVAFVGVDRAWWNANIFNATASQYIEAKIILEIGRDGNLASDQPVLFAGFVRKRPVIDEDEDSVEFDVATPEVIGDEMSAEAISTQYIDDDIDGSDTDGIILVEIPNLYAKDANKASYVLQTGVHLIDYEYNGGSPRGRLDGGLWVSFTGAGTYTLGNAAATADDTERLDVYVKTSHLALPQSDASAKIVVVSAGTTLPNVFYHGNHAQPLLDAIFATLGIDTVTFGTLEYTSHDSTQRLTFLDQPPQTGNIIGYKWAMVTDGTDLWVAVGHRLYKRDMSEHTYSLEATMVSGDTVEKMIYDSDGGYIWIYLNGDALRRFTISGSTLSSEVALANSDRDSFTLFYSSGTYTEHSILYVDNANKYIKRVDASTLAVTTLYTNGALGVDPHLGLGFFRAVGGGDDRYCFQSSTGGTEKITEISYDNTADSWSDQGETNSNRPDGYTIGAYHVSEDRIYYWDAVNFKVRKHPRTSTTGTDVLALTSYDEVHEFQYFTTGYVYFSTHEEYANGALKAGRLFAVNNSGYVLMSDTPAIYTKYFTFNVISPNIYGLDQYGRLFQWGSNLATYVPDADFEGMTVREALNNILIAFNFIATINAKRAFVYLRGNDSGVVQTTGNTLALTTSNTGQPLSRRTEAQPAFALVRLSNGTRWASYNGTAFNQNVQTDAARLEITNAFVPDEIIKDLAYRMYQFFKTKRDLIRVPVSDVAVEYEPCDGASLTGFDEVSSATGIIVGQAIDEHAGMITNILTPLS